jgi:ectoine hydroxylase-related dioxygenase (phytanoyl-CoA dioxygenase family)
MPKNSLKFFISQIKKNGYIKIDNLISKKLCKKLVILLEDDYSKYSKNYARPGKIKKNHLADKSKEKVVFNLHNKNLIWFKLFGHPLIINILDILLKKGSYNNNEPYYLNNISARTPLYGCPPQQLHIDGGLPGTNYALKINVLWCLEDFNSHTGFTRVVPRSHKIKLFPKNNYNYKSEKNLYAKAGSVIIFDASLWHGGSTSFSKSSRWGLILGYARWWIKPSFDFMFNTPKKIYNRLSVFQKRLLGFDSVPPKDEFTRTRRRSDKCEKPFNYKLPF